MQRDAHIPLFLWIATAVLAHLVGGGGATTAAKYYEEKLDLRRFAESVRRYVKTANTPTLEVALSDELPPPEPEPEQPEAQDPEAEKTEPSEEDPKTAEEQAKPEPEAPKKTPDTEPAPKPEEKKVEVQPEQPKLETPRPPPPDPAASKRIAVQQHVKDEQQKDNPDAEFLSEHNNRVEEQTRAQITSNDQNDPEPNPGSSAASAADQPGNANETRVAHSEDRPGEEGRPPSEDPAPLSPRQPPQPPARSGAAAMPDRPHAAQAATPPNPAAGSASQAANKAEEQVSSKAQVEQRAQAGSPDLMSAEQAAALAPSARNEQAAQAAREGRKKKSLPPRKSRGLMDMFGLGAAGTTAGGVNLNLTPGLARDAIGTDQLAREKVADGARRRSQHLGSWKTTGIERWRSAIENYVPSVKPGNQTALNSARSPFAVYLAMIHNRLHPVFADWFLASLDGLPANHPMNSPGLSTNLEIVLDREQGRIVRMGVTKTSGVTAFDIAALDSTQRSSPFGPPPREIVSPDGNVYLHWEFHRDPRVACTTANARPFMLKVDPKAAPLPSPEPPPPSEQHGSRGHDAGRRWALAD